MFLQVMLAENKYTEKLFAIKMIKKSFLKETDAVESAMTEQRILALTAGHQFIVTMHSSFQSAVGISFNSEPS